MSQNISEYEEVGGGSLEADFPIPWVTTLSQQDGAGIQIGRGTWEQNEMSK